jgi:hypothetical protein
MLVIELIKAPDQTLLPRSRRGTGLLAGVVWLAACECRMPTPGSPFRACIFTNLLGLKFHNHLDDVERIDIQFIPTVGPNEIGINIEPLGQQVDQSFVRRIVESCLRFAGNKPKQASTVRTWGIAKRPRRLNADRATTDRAPVGSAFRGPR